MSNWTEVNDQAYTVLNGTESTPVQSGHYNWPVLCFVLIVLLAIAGNVLVVLSVKFERKLRNMFNYFLVSLALSDMMSAVLVMPLSIVRALIEDMWIPKLLCVTWYSLDVLFTSSTIIHLCMISVDRFMSLKYPLKYGHAKKTRHMVLKIVIVWILSFCIAGPLFLLTMFDPQTRVSYKGCGPETTTFVLSATITSFYLPLVIMAIMYILTVRALHRSRQTQKKLAVNNTVTTASMWSLKDAGKGPSPGANGNARKSLQKQGSTESACPARSPLLGTKCNHVSPSLTVPKTTQNSNYLCVDNNIDTTCEISRSSTCTDIALQDLEVPELSSTDNGTKKYKVRTFRFKRENTANTSRRSNLDKGRRAVQVLGILFLVFIVFYLPFFLIYVINATCLNCRQYITAEMIMGFEWLAYSGSMINPIIYHVFNPDFRRAFHKLLRCKCSRGGV